VREFVLISISVHRSVLVASVSLLLALSVVPRAGAQLSEVAVEVGADANSGELPFAPIDSDEDGLLDREEDVDADGIVDRGETDPHDPDTDHDGTGDAEDLAPTHLEIPEPIAFDLVRGLGARAGEVEINTLVLSGPPGHAGDLRYAPEIEVAFADGVGLELELPIEGDTVEAYKGAIQGRISSADEGRWMHGFQVIAEYLIEQDVADAHVLWLVTGLITPNIAMVAILGGRMTFLGDEVRGRAILNLSAFHALGRDVWLGGEINASWDPLADVGTVRAIPQVHVSLHRSFRLQLGLGVEHDVITHPVGGARFIVEL